MSIWNKFKSCFKTETKCMGANVSYKVNDVLYSIDKSSKDRAEEKLKDAEIERIAAEDALKTFEETDNSEELTQSNSLLKNDVEEINEFLKNKENIPTQFEGLNVIYGDMNIMTKKAELGKEYGLLDDTKEMKPEFTDVTKSKKFKKMAVMNIAKQKILQGRFANKESLRKDVEADLLKYSKDKLIEEMNKDRKSLENKINKSLTKFIVENLKQMRKEKVSNIKTNEKDIQNKLDEREHLETTQESAINKESNLQSKFDKKDAKLDNTIDKLEKSADSIMQLDEESIENKQSFKDDLVLTSEKVKSKSKEVLDKSVTTGKDVINKVTETGKAGYDTVVETSKAGYNKAMETGKAGYDKAMETGKAGYDKAMEAGKTGYNKAMNIYGNMSEKFETAVYGKSFEVEVELDNGRTIKEVYSGMGGLKGKPKLVRDYIFDNGSQEKSVYMTEEVDLVKNEENDNYRVSSNSTIKGQNIDVGGKLGADYAASKARLKDLIDSIKEGKIVLSSELSTLDGSAGASDDIYKDQDKNIVAIIKNKYEMNEKSSFELKRCGIEIPKNNIDNGSFIQDANLAEELSNLIEEMKQKNIAKEHENDDLER